MYNRRPFQKLVLFWETLIKSTATVPLRCTFDTADDVEAVVLLAAHVKGDEGDEAGDLHEEVHEERHARVQGEGSVRGG